MSFKDAKSNQWDKTLKQILNVIVNLYARHDYLLAGKTLKQHEKNEFRQILFKQADEVVYENSLKMLTEYLFRFHKKESVVLIDEYDTPIQASHRHYYDEATTFMRNLLSGAFKDNKYLYKGVITGILRVSKESIFTGLNNVSVFSVLDHQFSEQFGFTESEITAILLDFNVSDENLQVKKWYNGYQFGKTTNIYNPWSILNYVQDVDSGFKAFWVNTSSDNLLKERISERDAHYTREQLLKLINGETIEKIIDENFVFSDLDTDKELLWSLLLFSGYLTSIDKIGRKSYELAIPNYEIKTVFQDIILKWFNVDIKVKQNILIETAHFLIQNKIEAFERGFKEIIGDTFSYFDIKNESENVYQAYTLGLLAIIGDDYIIKSNRESGTGRYDIMIIPKDKNNYGVVIEIKQITKNKKESESIFRGRINKKIQEALNQIEDNKYYRELADAGISKIIKLPIVFSGKEPYITVQS